MCSSDAVYQGHLLWLKLAWHWGRGGERDRLSPSALGFSGSIPPQYGGVLEQDADSELVQMKAGGRHAGWPPQALCGCVRTVRGKGEVDQAL